jgi:Tfp pilus assembly protein PilF
MTPRQTLTAAAAAVARGDYARARALLDQALAESPPPTDRAQLLTMRGTVCEEQDDLPAALHNYRQAIRFLEQAGETIGRGEAWAGRV